MRPKQGDYEMQFTLRIKSDNAAFEEEPITELARILRELADDLEGGNFPSSVRDYNGNKVGTVTLK